MKNTFTKTGLTVLFILGSLMTLNAQTYNWVWAKSAGGTSSEESIGNIGTDASGNIYVAGDFYSHKLTFGNITLTNRGANWHDIFIVKYDVNGNVIWAKSAGGTDDDVVTWFSIDANGNIVVFGDFYSAGLTFDMTTITNIDHKEDDAYIIKCDSSGNLLWIKDIGGVGGLSIDRALGNTVDDSGNVYVTGFYDTDTLYFSPTEFVTKSRLGTFNTDVYICKYDANGHVLWAKSIGGDDYKMIYNLTTDINGNMYAGGYFNNDTLFLDATHYIVNDGRYTNLLLVKYDPNGNIVWIRYAKISASDYGIANIVTDGSGSVYVVGSFNSDTIHIDNEILINTNASGNSSDGFIIKYDTNGNVLWTKTIGGTGNEDIYGLTTDASGHIFITGDFSSDSLKLNNTTTLLNNSGKTKMFVAACDAQGNILWGNSVDGNGTSSATSMTIHNNDNIYLCGSFSDSVSIGNTSLSSAGGNDLFIAKLASGCNTFSNLNITASCKGYEFNGKTLTVSGTYKNTLTAAGGCDSIVTLDLTIIDTVWNILTDTACDHYTLNGKTYTSSGTYDQAYTSSEGCDSILTLHLVLNHSDTTVITACAFNSFTLNHQTYRKSGNYYIQTLFNTAGCDSTVMLQLNIYLATQNGNTLTAIAPAGTTYQWIDCNAGNAPVSGATDSSYTPIIAGDYAVIVTDNGCSDTSDCYSVTLQNEGVKNIEQHSMLQLYPNPTTGALILKSTLPGIKHIQITNAVGQEVYHTIMKGYRQNIDLSTQPDGFYFVHVYMEKGSRVYKIAITK